MARARRAATRARQARPTARCVLSASTRQASVPPLRVHVSRVRRTPIQPIQHLERTWSLFVSATKGTPARTGRLATPVPPARTRRPSALVNAWPVRRERFLPHSAHRHVKHVLQTLSLLQTDPRASAKKGTLARRAQLVPQARTRQTRAPEHAQTVSPASILRRLGARARVPAQPVLRASILRRLRRRARVPAPRARQTPTHQQAVLRTRRANATQGILDLQAAAQPVPRARTRPRQGAPHAQPVLPASILRRLGRRARVPAQLVP